MNWRELVCDRLHRTGYDIVRYPLTRYLLEREINVVLDVGANTGQYAQELRELGYMGRIVSFEPLSEAYEKLSMFASADSAMDTMNVAIGRESAEVEINVSGLDCSSSFLQMLPSHIDINEDYAPVAKETAKVITLDSIFQDHVTTGDCAFLKIDTQGFEREVIEGAQDSLANIVGLQVELTLTPLYSDQPLIEDIILVLRDYGFVPVWLQHGFKDPQTQYLKQVDGFFMRQE